MLYLSASGHYKQQLTTSFDRRTHYDRPGSFHPAIAERLVELAKPNPGDSGLD